MQITIRTQDAPPLRTTSVQRPIHDEAAITLIRADLLIPGRGDPVKDAALAIKAGKIDWVGAAKDLPDKYSDIKATSVPVLMPGLWDCHVHFMGIAMDGELAKLSPYLPGFNALAGALSAEDLRETLMAGITSVRDLGGFGCDLWPGVKSGFLVGPNIYGAVAAMSITGGHGDDHMQPIKTVLDGASCGGMPVEVCDGVDGCIRAVRTVVRRGARVIKVCSSGGVLSLNDDPEDRQFSDAELKAIVEEAGRSRRAVAAHAIGKAGILAGIRAGVRSIEHGMYIDEEVADLMVEKDILFVPTQHIVRTIMRDYLDGLPQQSRDKVLKLADRSKESYKIALKKGVRFALGTDTLSSDRSSRLSHGNNVNELVYAVELGMTPLQAIEASTANSPDTLGGMAPLSGQLKEGFDADVIAISENPLKDISVLTEKANITHVWKGGKLFKCPA